MRPALAMAFVLAACAVTAPGAEGDLMFSADAGVARIDGTSYERVYNLIDHGALAGRYHKLSELVWDLDNVYGVRASAALEMNHRVEWRASAFSALSEGTGGMVDYDWFLFDRPDFWTHVSRSTVRVTTALDVDLRGTLHVLRDRPVSLDAMVGWRYMNFRWEDQGIDYVYSSLGAPNDNPEQGYTYEQINPEAVRDLSGDDTRAGVVYEQSFHIPYVGLGAGLRRGGLQINGEVVYSPIVAAQDRDEHLLRNLLFEGSFVGGTYLAWKVTLTQRILRHLFVTASYESQTIDEFRGNMSVFEIGGAHVGTLSNGISVEHASRQTSVAIGVTF